MRPTYETKGDLSAEDRVARDLARRWNVEIRKTAKYQPYDRVVLNDGVVKCLLEIKVRSASYGTYWISLSKWQALVATTDAVGLPCLLVVRWPEDGKEATRYVTVKKGPRDIIWGGRTDRGDPADEEPMVVIKIDEMTKIGD